MAYKHSSTAYEQTRPARVQAQNKLCTCGCELKRGVKFCTQCGKDVTTLEKKCEGCESKMAPGDKFCGTCGRKKPA